MDNAAKNAEAIRAVRDRLVNELAELDRLDQALAANALSHAIDLLNDGRGALDKSEVTGYKSAC